jgi:DNA ligase D-like protein (predicted 3'-phosphoesterase)
MNREYCIQHHVAKRAGPHDDFRFEDGGIAVSFCIPKGMKKHPRPVLAIRVQDHELGYMDFEGVIEEGHGGAGTVELRERGTLKLIKWVDGETLKVEIGKRAFTFVRFTTSGNPNHWLLLPSKACE